MCFTEGPRWGFVGVTSSRDSQHTDRDGARNRDRTTNRSRIRDRSEQRRIKLEKIA
jgi:hypothetical protein